MSDPQTQDGAELPPRPEEQGSDDRLSDEAQARIAEAKALIDGDDE
jgi:hypothetical protein